MKPEIRMSAPDIDLDDQRAVVEAFTSGVLSLGPRVEEFERLR
jgi:dTDP-4-amino-4,6-dideoxygalactose transaminase